MKFLLILLIAGFPGLVMAQLPGKSPLRTVYVNPNVSTHFVCPEPVNYFDLSTSDVVGDIPDKNKNIVRVKDTAEGRPNMPTILTIVGQKFMVQYRLVYADAQNCPTKIEINDSDISVIDDARNYLSESELAYYSYNVLKSRRDPFHAVSSLSSALEARVTRIETKGDYFFLKVTLRNHTKIQYDIDQVRFSVEDKKIVKATNYQSQELTPLYMVNRQLTFQRKWENVYVFKKFTFPGTKEFTITIYEKQVSGRQVVLHVRYSDILNADAL